MPTSPLFRLLPAAGAPTDTGMALFVFLVCVSLGCDIIGHDPTPGPGDVGTIVYSAHIQPVFNNRCAACHGGNVPAAGLRLDSWEGVIAGSNHGEAVIPFHAERSVMISLLTDLTSQPHPGDVNEDVLSSDEVGLIRRWIEEGARSDTGEVPHAMSANRIFITSMADATISIIDTDALVVSRLVDLVDLGFNRQARPYDVVVEPDGSGWYASLTGADRVLKFDRDNELVGQVALQDPGLLALDAARGQLWVGRAVSSVQPASSLGLIHTAGMTLEEVDVTFPLPHAMVLGPDASTLYSTSFDVDQFMSIDTGTRDVTITGIQGEEKAYIQFAVRPGMLQMWGSASGSDQLTMFDLTDPSRPEQRQSLFTGSDPWDLAFLPDGLRLYVANRGADEVTVLDASLGVVSRVIGHEALKEPSGIAISRDGSHVFIASENTDGQYEPRHVFAWRDRVGTVAVVSTATDTVVKVLEVGAGAYGATVQ